LGQQLIQFAVSIVLARLLLPADFGLVGMLLVFSGFASLFAEFGFAGALIYQPGLTRVQASSIFWLNTGVGLLLSVLFFALSPLIAAFFTTAALAPLGRAFSPSFLLGALGIVPRALLQREMSFQRMAEVELASSVVAGTVGIALALAGFGVWSLVIQSLTASLVGSVLALRAARWVPGLTYSAAAVRDLLSFSGNLFGFNFINYWARNADNLLVGKFMGSVSLGIYNRAYTIMLLPVRQVIAVLSRVMFPALSQIQGEKARVREVYLRAIAVIALVTFPMMTGLLVVARPFVLALLGAKWTGVIPVLQVFCVVSLFQTLMNPTGWIFQSQGRTDLLFRWGIASSTVSIAAIGVGVALGTVEAVAWSYLLSTAILWLPCLALAGRLIDLPVMEVVRRITDTIACTAMMAGSVLAVGYALPTDWAPAAVLSVEVSVGIVAYGLAVAVLRPAGSQELRALVASRRLRRSAA
jgi:PST family polysaccharide transporter